MTEPEMKPLSDNNAIKLLISFYIAMVFGIIGVSLVVSCGKDEPYFTEAPLKEFKITMTLDSLYKMAGVEKNLRANDGILNWVWLGDGFSQQNKSLFDAHCDHQEAFLKTLYPFDSLWAADKLKFDRRLVNGNLNCKSFGFESLDCSWDKIVKAAFANGLQPDFIHLFCLGKGFGTGNSGIGVLGIGTGMPSALDYCDYWDKLKRMNGHEDGHGWGLDHALYPTYPVNLMSQATDGGCALGYSYLQKDYRTILTNINSRIN